MDFEVSLSSCSRLSYYKLMKSLVLFVSPSILALLRNYIFFPLIITSKILNVGLIRRVLQIVVYSLLDLQTEFVLVHLPE